MRPEAPTGLERLPATKAERIRARSRALRARADRVAETAQAGRSRHGSLDVALELVDRDLEVGGGIIAGALAYRLFIWQLPLALVCVGGLGIAADAAGRSPRDVASSAGLGGLIASSFQSSGDTTAQWYALLVGLPILVVASRSVLRVLIGTHRLAWGDVRASAPRPTLGSSLFLLGVLLAYYAAGIAAGWTRQEGRHSGLLATLAVAAVFAGGWLLVSRRLPHRGAATVDLVPGALLFGAGMELLQLAAAYLLAPYALAKQGTYGALGTAAAVLVALFLIGRLMVGAAELNATLWERKARRA